MKKITQLAIMTIFLWFKGAYADLSALLEPILESDIPVQSRIVADSIAKKKVKSKAKVNENSENQAIVVEIPSYKLDEQGLLSQLKVLLEEKYKPEGEFKLKLARPWHDLIVKVSGPTCVEIEEYPIGGLESTMIVGFKLMNERQGDRVSLGSYQVVVKAELWRDAYAMNRTLSSGKILQDIDARVQPVDLLKLKDAPLPIGLDFGKYEMAQTVGANRILYWRDLKECPQIRKGQLVDVYASEGSMKIMMKAISLQDGVQDSFISVRNLESKNVFQAKIIDGKSVQVYF